MVSFINEMDVGEEGWDERDEGEDLVVLCRYKEEHISCLWLCKTN